MSPSKQFSSQISSTSDQLTAIESSNEKFDDFEEEKVEKEVVNKAAAQQEFHTFSSQKSLSNDDNSR